MSRAPTTGAAVSCRTPQSSGFGAFFLPSATGILGRSSSLVPHLPMFRVLALFLLACLLTPAIADERAQTQQQLDQAAKDVAELKKLLQQLQQEKSGVQQDLKKTESDMGQLEKQVKDLQQELDKGEDEVKRLDQEKKNSRARVLNSNG